jgi:hypothetical protein
MKQVAALALGSSPIVTFGALQILSGPQTPHWAAVSDDFFNPRFWLTVVVLLIAGAFGGISYELLLRGGAIELPHRVRPDAVGRKYTHAPAESLIATGFVGRGVVGASAALSVLLVLAPSSAHAALALGVTSGAAAPALIRLMRRQLMFAADLLTRMQREPRDPQPRAESESTRPASSTPAGSPAPAAG